MWHRFGHMQNVLVKDGDTVNKGQQLGTIGTGNGAFSAHLHYDIFREKPKSWTSYVYGMTKEQVKAFYEDPTALNLIVFPKFHHYGWEYLDRIVSGGKVGYHPGNDLNGPGAGNADLGLPFFSPCDGKIVYCYAGSGRNGGWGKLVCLEELTTPVPCLHCPTHCPK